MLDPLGRLLLRWRIRIVLPHVRGRALDIGCGTNELMRSYRASGGDGTGVDVYPWPNVDRLLDSTAELPFESGSFDTVCLVAALNHIPYRELVLAECRRVLIADGRLLVTMIPPLISRVWHFLRSPWDHDQMERGMKEGEVFGFTRREIARLARDAGFRVVRRRRFMLVNSLTVLAKDDQPAVSH